MKTKKCRCGGRLINPLAHAGSVSHRCERCSRITIHILPTGRRYKRPNHKRRRVSR